MIDFDKKEEPPTPAPGVSTLPPAPPPEKVFMDIGKETPIEQLRGNIEASIKLASIPVAQMVEKMKYFEELDKEVSEGASVHSAYNKWRTHYYTQVQNKMGAVEGYNAALAQAMIAFMQEQRREQ